METISRDLPCIPFGKYKGQEITKLFEDPNYTDWCLRQPWFKDKYSKIYNIVVTKSIYPTDTPTPEHNKLQNLFLHEINCKKLFQIIDGERTLTEIYTTDAFKKLFNRPFKIQSGYEFIGEYIPEFEGRFNWDIIIRIKPNAGCKVIIEQENYDKIKFQKINHLFNNKNISLHYTNTWERDGTDEPLFIKNPNLPPEPEPEPEPEPAPELDPQSKFDLFFNFKQKTPSPPPLINGICELFLTLRNEHITLYCELKTSLGDDYPCVLRKMKNQIKLTKGRYDSHYVLLVKDFESDSATEDDLKKIFKQTGIRVIFLRELNFQQL